jgi:hypothetical protein
MLLMNSFRVISRKTATSARDIPVYWHKALALLLTVRSLPAFGWASV